MIIKFKNVTKNRRLIRFEFRLDFCIFNALGYLLRQFLFLTDSCSTGKNTSEMTSHTHVAKKDKILLGSSLHGIIRYRGITFKLLYLENKKIASK